MNNKVHTLTLIITHRCNLDCAYCYERHKSRRMMTCDMALCVVSQGFVTATQAGCKVFHVTFMGGEPFLNFDVIKSVVEWMQNQKTNVRMEAYATTNGTVLTEEMKDWLVAHKDIFKVQLSYDGTPVQQQANRTSRAIDIDFFLATFPRQGVHVTISKQTLPRLSEGVRYILDKGAQCSTTLAIGTEWADQDAIIYLRELRDLADAYLIRYTDREPIPALNGSLHLIGSRNIGKPTCRDCIDFLVYDVDGTTYPCHLFSPLVVGQERSITLDYFEKDDRLMQYGGKDDPCCSDCPLCNWCPTCYGFNYLFTGSTGARNNHACKMMFAQALAASEYQICYFNTVGVTETTASKAKAAIHAYRTLRNNKNLCETLCNETPHVCQPRKNVRGALKNDRKEAAV